MAQKPDYYEVLGVAKTATEAEIKQAHQKLVLRFHPDRHRAKSEDDKKKFLDEKITSKSVRAAVTSMEGFVQLLTEAEKVLTDSGKRMTYDNYGHQGLENAANGKSAGTGQSWSDAAGPTKPLRTYSEDDTFSFFDKVAERNGNSSGGFDDGLTPDQRRAKAREARRNRRGGNSNSDFAINTPVEQPVQPVSTPQADFTAAVSEVKNASDKMRTANQSGVTLPLETLERFRENLQDFMGEVDKAIAQAKKAPKNGYNR